MARHPSSLVCWLALALPSAAALAQSAPVPLVVHEWGTFTSLQEEDGSAIGGINTDDEPVPKFVHRVSDDLLLQPTELPPSFFQGAPAGHPDVTMRLETPVLYFHPSPNQPSLEGVTVVARFRGGWLTEFYPKAAVTAPGVLNARGVREPFAVGSLHSGTVSSLTWSDLTIGDGGEGPKTNEHVWIAPREVRAAPVRTAAGEAEKYLFYRGVAHIDAPLAVSQQSRTGMLTLRSQFRSLPGQAPLTLKSLWLVDIATNGRVAFRTIPGVRLDDDGTKVLATVTGTFEPGDYSDSNLDKLKWQMHAALVSEGLFGDEAQALLETWKLSYFRSTGLRLFFMVPRAWTDLYLPLHISTPAELTRVMVGRIELVTAMQREYLRQLAQIPRDRIHADALALHERYYNLLDNPRSAAVASGAESLEAFGVEVPASYRLYLSLGRFRNALLLNQAREHPSPSLDQFIATYHLESYKPGSLAAAN